MKLGFITTDNNSQYQIKPADLICLQMQVIFNWAVALIK